MSFPFPGLRWTHDAPLAHLAQYTPPRGPRPRPATRQRPPPPPPPPPTFAVRGRPTSRGRRSGPSSREAPISTPNPAVFADGRVLSGGWFFPPFLGWDRRGADHVFFPILLVDSHFGDVFLGRLPLAAGAAVLSGSSISGPVGGFPSFSRLSFSLYWLTQNGYLGKICCSSVSYGWGYKPRAWGKVNYQC